MKAGQTLVRHLGWRHLPLLLGLVVALAAPQAIWAQDAADDTAPQDAVSPDQEPPGQEPPGQEPAVSDEDTVNDVNEAVDSGGVGQLRIELSTQEITVGDQVEATLTLAWMGAEPTAPPRFPTWQDTWGSSEVLAHSEVESSQDDSGRRLYRQRLTLTSFEVGEVDLPTTSVVVPLQDRNAEVRNEGELGFAVLSVLPEASEEDEELQPKSAAALRGLAGQGPFLWTLAVLSLLTVGAAVFFLRRVRLSSGALGGASAPWVPPLKALLDFLQGVDPASGSEPVGTAISFALRRYLSQRLSWNAVGSTTSEIQKQLRTTRVTTAVMQTIVTTLRDCDQVKFARQEVSSSVNADRLARARELGRSLEEMLQPPPQVDTDQASPQPSGHRPARLQTQGEGR